MVNGGHASWGGFPLRSTKMAETAQNFSNVRAQEFPQQAVKATVGIRHTALLKRFNKLLIEIVCIAPRVPDELAGIRAEFDEVPALQISVGQVRLSETIS